MGRFCSLTLGFAFAALFILNGCGNKGGGATTIVAAPTPGIIILSPTPSAALELGKTQQFIAAAQDANANAVTTPLQFVSNNTAVVTVSSGGLACAGTWDSLTSPQICTPGQSGTAQITATGMGVSSPATTVYVHQHIDNVTLNAAPAQIATPACLSKDHTFNYEARAFARGADITSNVGPFTWVAANANVVTVNTTVTGLLQNQAQITANVPGKTFLSASLNGVTSVPLDVTTCLVQSISLLVDGNANTTRNVPENTTLNVTTTVTDTSNTVITGVPLTWSSANPKSATVTATNDTAVITTTLAGGSTIIASCTPPACNIGTRPSQPVYPNQVINLTVQSTTNTPVSTTVWVTSTACGTIAGCIPQIVPITTSTSATTPANTVGISIGLPATPNSFVFDRLGDKAYLGTDLGLSATKGLMVLSANAVSQFISAPGKVLAVSPDGTRVIVSDTADTPNQLFLFNSTTNSSTPFSITGATAAAFSPDNLKTYVIAGSTLYVFSTQDALQTIPLTAPAFDVSFLPQGGTAILDGGVPPVAGHGVLTKWNTISNAQIGTAVDIPTPPSFIRALPDNNTVLTVNTPGVDLLNLTTTGVGLFNFGAGNFTAKQLIISPDSTKVYVVTSNLSVIPVFDLNSKTSSAIALANNAVPTAASLTSDGMLLYVTGSDGDVHVVDTVTNTDIQQVTFPNSFCTNSAGTAVPNVLCKPDLIAVTP